MEKRTLPVDLVAGDPIARRLAAIRLHYLILFPNVTSERNEALVTTSAETLGKYTDDPEELVRRGVDELARGCAAHMGAPCDAEFRAKFGDDPRASEAAAALASTSLGVFARELFTPAGGFSGVARAKGTDSIEARIARLWPDIRTVGIAMLVLYAMHHHHSKIGRGGASMNKVWWLLEQWSPEPFVARAESSLRKKWRIFRDVAHLAGALEYLVSVHGIEDGNPILNRTDELLKLAKRLEDFGLSFRPANSEPILDPRTVWRIPLDSPTEGAIDYRLPLKAQLKLAEYKAPSPF
jgi:hypothetical protein